MKAAMPPTLSGEGGRRGRMDEGKVTDGPGSPDGLRGESRVTATVPLEKVTGLHPAARLWANTHRHLYPAS